MSRFWIRVCAAVCTPTVLGAPIGDAVSLQCVQSLLMQGAPMTEERAAGAMQGLLNAAPTRTCSSYNCTSSYSREMMRSKRSSALQSRRDCIGLRHCGHTFSLRHRDDIN